jgi:hypothetical protein
MYELNRISEKSYPQIKSLIKKCFHQFISLDFVKNKYKTEGFGAKDIGYFAVTSQNEFSAYYGVFPITLTFDNKDFLVAQSGDTMTSPAHQKKGLFTKLALETYRLAEKEGVQMVFGFPNENSVHGFKTKLNWSFNQEMEQFKLRGSKLPICEISSKNLTLNSFYQKFVKNKIKKYKLELTKEHISTFSIKTSKGFIKKDINFFEYKLNNLENHLIQINGFDLLIKANGHLKIGAVGYFNELKLNDFNKTIRELASKLFCKKIIFTMSKNHWLYDFLIKDYNPEKSLPIGFFEINREINIQQIEFTFADYDTF